MKKNQVNIRIVILAFVLLVFSVVVLAGVNYKLQKKLADNNAFMERVTLSDSVFTEKNKEYVRVLNKYISECNIVLDGKVISISQLIDIYNQNSKEHNEMFDKYYAQKDTADKYKMIYSMTQRMYGITFIAEKQPNGQFLFKRGKFLAIDSGLLLLEGYRSAIGRDSNGEYYVSKFAIPQ